MQFNDQSSEGQIWNKPWSTDTLRDHSQSWSLAGDSGLLNKLQDMAQTLVLQTHQTQQEVNALVKETEGTHSRLHNIVNDFLMLSNTQFVESRVYDEEIINSPSETKSEMPGKKTKEEKDAEVIGKVAEALHLGMSVIDVAYEQLDLPNSDSEEDSEPYGHEPLLHPKERYANRRLPCVIGSQLFCQDDHLGLGGNLSDEDEIADEVSSISSEDSPRPARKESVENLEKFMNTNNYENEDNSDESRNSDIFNAKVDRDDEANLSDGEDFMSPNRNFEKELAAKLKKVSSDAGSVSSDNSVNEETSKRTSKKSKPVNTSGNRRGSSTSNHSSNSKRKEDTRKKQINPQPRHASDEDDDDDGELFGNKAMFSRKGGLFDDEINEDDLFAGSKTSKVPDNSSHGRLFTESIEGMDAEKDKQIKPSSTRQRPFSEEDLFMEESEELFKSPVTNEKKVTSKRSSIFEEDEDSLFENKVESNEETSIPKKKLLPGAVSMFGGAVNPLSFKIQSHHSKESNKDQEPDNISQASSSNKTASIGDLKKGSPNNSGSSSSTAIFTDGVEEDDLFSISIAPQSKKSNIRDVLFGGNEEDDFENIFAEKPKPQKTVFKSINTEQKTTPLKSSKSLFYDEEQDDLFAEIAKPKEKISSGSSLFGENLSASKVASTSKPNEIVQVVHTEQVKPASKVSLFDDEDSIVDLFGEILPNKSTKSEDKSLQSSQVRPRGKSLFEDEDLLFGTVPTDNPEVDLFGNIGQATKMKGGEKKSDGEKLTSEDSGPAIMENTKSDVKLFDDNDEEDLFGKSTNTDKVPKKVAKPLPSPRKQVAPKVSESIKDTISTEDQNTQDEVASSKLGKNEPSLTDSPRKKPVGGVALFGGMMPPLLKHPRAHSPIKAADIQDGNMIATERTSSPKPGAFIVSPGGTGRPSSIIKAEIEAAVSFDDPIEANPLHNANKDRIRIQVKRRLPTRRARQDAIRKSAIDMPTDSNGLLHTDADDTRTSVSAPTSPITPESSSGFPTSTTDSSNNKLTIDTARIASIASPSTEEEDLFSIGDPIHQRFTNQARDTKNSSSKLDLESVSSSSKTSEGKDLFGGSSDDGDADDLFKPKPKTRANLSTKKASRRPSPKPSPKPDRKPPSEKSSSAINDTDTSSTISKIEEKNKPSSRLFSLKDSSDEDKTSKENDLFSEASKQAKAPVKAKTTKVLTDSETSSGKPKNRLDLSTRTKSLFDDDNDDDDLFKTCSTTKSSAKTPTNNATTAKKESSVKTRAKPTSIFKDDEDGDDLFEDPLMGGKK